MICSHVLAVIPNVFSGEGFLESSGVLAVVVLGVYLGSNRTNVSPEVEAFLHRLTQMMRAYIRVYSCHYAIHVHMSSRTVHAVHETFSCRFWQMLAYLANTLIFVLVGIQVMKGALENITGADIILNLSLYCALVVVR